MTKPEWTKYSEQEYTQRWATIVEEFGISLEAHRRTETPEGLLAVSKSIAYALENIPTRRLGECFRKATQSHTSHYPMGADAVLAIWEELKAAPPTEDYDQYAHISAPILLDEGFVRKDDYLSVAEWKELHNLPKEWEPGKPYPAESDLYGKTLPVEEILYTCWSCKDAGWTRRPYDPRTMRSARLIPCGCKGGGKND